MAAVLELIERPSYAIVVLTQTKNATVVLIVCWLLMYHPTLSAAILKPKYGGHKERISSSPISENVRNILEYICAKFGACITKCTILLNIWVKLAAPLIRQRVMGGNH